MLRTTTGAIRALHAQGYLCLSRHPAAGDTWTVAEDPSDPGAPGAQQVAEYVVFELIDRGMVEPGGPTWYRLITRH